MNRFDFEFLGETLYSQGASSWQAYNAGYSMAQRVGKVNVHEFALDTLQGWCDSSNAHESALVALA